MAPDDLFRYDGYVIDSGTRLRHCHYATAQPDFTERFTFESAATGPAPLSQAAVRLLYLVAGVSYYKTTAAPVIDLGDLATSSLERSFLIELLHTRSGRIRLPQRHRPVGTCRSLVPTGSEPPSPAYEPERGRPLIPFGGGIDSIVTVDALSLDHPEAALCVVNPTR